MEVARWLAAVEAALGSEDLAGARTALARLGELAPEHAELGALRARLEEAAARAARRERMAAVATSVREHLSRDDIDAAGRAVDEALALDGEDPEARALAERVEARRAERERAQQAALEQRVAQAEARLASGNLASAIEQFEAILADDRNHQAAARGLAEARSRKTAQEAQEAAAVRRATLDAQTADGRLRLSDGDLAGAIERFKAVLREDGSHAGAQQGLAAARERRAALDAEEAAAARRSALDVRVAEGRLRLSEGDVAGAVKRFEGVLVEDANHAEARQALEEARHRLEGFEGRVTAARQRATLEARVAAGRLRLAGGDVVGAIERFEAVLSEDDGHLEARQELAEARQRLTVIEEWGATAARRAALDARVAEAQARLAAGDLHGAAERFEAVLRDDGSHAAAQQGRAAVRERQAALEAQEQEAARSTVLDAQVAEARVRLALGDLGGAIERFESVLRDDGAHAEAQRGLAEARERWAALEAQEAEAEARLASGDLGGAIERFEAVLREDGTHAAARRGLGEARARRAALEAREAEVAAALAALERTLQEPDMAAVQAAFAWLVDLAPEHPKLASLRERIEEHAQRVEEDREQMAREALADAGRLIREGRVDPALEALARARAWAPQHPDLPKLERQAQRIVAGRDQRTRALVASAREALERDDLAAARRAAEEALGLDAKHPEAAALLERAQARGRELDQTRRADELATEAGKLLGAGKLDEGTARLSELRELAPAHRALGDLSARLEEARKAEARRSDPAVIVKTALDEAARLIRDGRPERVPEVLARVRAVSPEHPQLAKLEAQAQRVLEAREVRVRVRGLVDRARKLQVKGELKEALALAEEAVGLTPDDAWALRLRDDLVEQLKEPRRRGKS